ncbi:30S ribosomal protein S6 [candidate division CSSED10-310 bacterium]|uniref:Small ribosomal subunit protein bS6 n=1 Tax=candidate division CSSED10-310 bacterium TaxID=2855610 RepID=A0ABV6YUX3_UNCC1
MKTLRHYELIFIISPTLEDKEAEITAREVKDLIVEKGAQIHYSETWGKRKLAYEVKKQRYGFYSMIHMEGSVETVNEIDRNLKLHEHVIKFLVVKLEPEKVGKASALNPDKMKEEV